MDRIISFANIFVVQLHLNEAISFVDVVEAQTVLKEVISFANTAKKSTTPSKAIKLVHANRGSRRASLNRVQVFMPRQYFKGPHHKASLQNRLAKVLKKIDNLKKRNERDAGFVCHL